MNNELKEFHRICSKYLVRDGLTNCYKTPAYDNELGNVIVAEWSKLNGYRLATFLKYDGYFSDRVRYYLEWDIYALEQLESKLKEIVEFVKNETVNIKKRRLEKDFV